MKVLILMAGTILLLSCSKSEATRNCICHYDNPNIAGDQYDLDHGTGYTARSCDAFEVQTHGGEFTSCELY